MGWGHEAKTHHETKTHRRRGWRPSRRRSSTNTTGAAASMPNGKGHAKQRVYFLAAVYALSAACSTSVVRGWLMPSSDEKSIVCTEVHREIGCRRLVCDESLGRKNMCHDFCEREIFLCRSLGPDLEGLRQAVPILEQILLLAPSGLVNHTCLMDGLRTLDGRLNFVPDKKDPEVFFFDAASIQRLGRT